MGGTEGNRERQGNLNPFDWCPADDSHGGLRIKPNSRSSFTAPRLQSFPSRRHNESQTSKVRHLYSHAEPVEACTSHPATKSVPSLPKDSG